MLCVTSPQDVQLLYFWMGSNDIDYHHRTSWSTISDGDADRMGSQIRDADVIVAKILNFVHWISDFMPNARLAYCSITPRGYWNEYARRVQRKVNIGMETQRDKDITVLRMWQHLPIGQPPFTMCDRTHYSRLSYHVLFGYLMEAGQELLSS